MYRGIGDSITYTYPASGSASGNSWGFFKGKIYKPLHVTSPMAVKLKVQKWKNGYWLYLPKAIVQLYDEPEAFEARILDNLLVLNPVTKK